MDETSMLESAFGNVPVHNEQYVTSHKKINIDT